MKTALFATAVASLALISTAAPAAAATYVETYYGIIDSTIPETFTSLPGAIFPPSVMDSANLFGGGDLQGDFITATFYYDTALGVANSGTDYDTGLPFVSLDGGFDYDGVTPSPITYVDFQVTTPDLTVYDYAYDPDVRGDVVTEPGGLVYDKASSSVGDDAYVGLVTPDSPADFSTPFFSSTYPNGTTGSYFASATNDAGQYDLITFDTYAVTVSGTPEASTWALMLVGVGGIGVMLRRARRRVGNLLSA